VRVILSLARHSFVGALRERAFLVLLLYLAAIVTTAGLIGPLALGENRRVTIDVGLSAVELFGFLLIALLGGRMVQTEIDRRTILVLLAKPIHRAEFLLGKFLGLVSILGVSLAGMLALLAGVMAACGLHPDAMLLEAGYFAFLELVVVAALAMLLTVFTSPVLASFFLVGLYIAGHLGPSLLELGHMMSHALLGQLVAATLWLLPRLDLYGHTLQVVHGVRATPAQLGWAAAYAVLYPAGILLLALAAFRRREFA
jgi:Cu-processing system permease protein